MKSISFSKVLFFALSLCLLAMPTEADAQKSLKKRDKALEKQLKAKPVKVARKDAKKLGKEGYRAEPGKPNLALQLERSYKFQIETDENGFPKYLIGSAEAVAETKIAAKNQAMEAAKLELAGQIESNIVGLIENSFANKQLNMEEAASLTKTVTSAKNIISQKIGRVLELFAGFRETKAYSKNKVIAYTVTIAYNQQLAMDSAKQAIRESLEEDAEELHKKLDQILDF